MMKRCDIPAMTLPPCDLEWGHDGDMHANAGDGFYARQWDEEHRRRQVAHQKTGPSAKPTFPDDMDPACVPLCEALCALPGIETTGSCEGHGKKSPIILFRAKSFAALHPIVRAIDPRYYRADPPWRLEIVETDLVDDRLRFVLQTTSAPADAAAMLAALARDVVDAVGRLAQWERGERVE